MTKDTNTRIMAMFAIWCITILTVVSLFGYAHAQQHHPKNLDTFLNADTTNGSHKYVLGSHDCMDFSIAMAENLSANGYDTGVVFVLAKDPYTNYSHMLVWVNISNETYYVEPMHDYVYVPYEYIQTIDSKSYVIHEIPSDTAKNMRAEMRNGAWDGRL